MRIYNVYLFSGVAMQGTLVLMKWGECEILEQINWTQVQFCKAAWVIGEVIANTKMKVKSRGGGAC